MAKAALGTSKSGNIKTRRRATTVPSPCSFTLGEYRISSSAKYFGIRTPETRSRLAIDLGPGLVVSGKGSPDLFKKPGFEYHVAIRTPMSS